jgi:hypothetical protein
MLSVHDALLVDGGLESIGGIGYLLVCLTVSHELRQWCSGQEP